MKNFANIYISLFLFYYLQGILYAKGSIVSQLVLVVLLLASLYYWLYSILHYKLPMPLRILSIMLLIWTIYGAIPIMFGVGSLMRSVPPFSFLKGIYLSLLPVFPFFVFVRKGWLDEQLIKKWFFAFLVVAIANFYEKRNELMMMAIEGGDTREEFTNNEGYVLLSLLPLLPLFEKKPFLQYILLFICMLYVLIGFKRGAILAGAICSIWMIIQSFANKDSKHSSKGRTFTRFVLTIAIVSGTIIAVRYLLSTSDFFNYRLNVTLEGGSSGRDSLYSLFWNTFVTETNVFRLLFGRGAYGTLEITSNYAHNDWLEIAIDNGLLFIFLYIAYWISLFSLYRNSKKGLPETMMLGMFIIINFLKTFFSMSYLDLTPYATCAFGYALAMCEMNRVSSYSR